MKFAAYKNDIINKICSDSPIYLKQKLINSIRQNRIGEYKSKDNNIINLSGMTREEKINECLHKNRKTFKLLDLLEIKKGYKYSILYKNKNINFEHFINELEKCAINVESEYYNIEDDKEIDYSKLMFYDTKDLLFIKAHKQLSKLNRTKNQIEFFRYPILFVFHKKLNIFECRFDKLSYDDDCNFYKITMDSRLSELSKLGNFTYESYELERTIKKIVEEKKTYIQAVIWSFESAKSKGLTLKVGEDGVLPFIGDLEIILSSLREKHSSNDEAMECINEITEYVDKTKRFANERFRILTMSHLNDGKGNAIKLDKSIEFKIIFNYSKHNFDLFSFYDNEINDMERINYVIEFIRKFENEVD